MYYKNQRFFAQQKSNKKAGVFAGFGYYQKDVQK
jgi:hypothetical protein